jgi:hypothetical protein
VGRVAATSTSTTLGVLVGGDGRSCRGAARPGPWFGRLVAWGCRYHGGQASWS